MKKHWNKQKKKKNSNLTKIFRNFATINPHWAPLQCGLIG